VAKMQEVFGGRRVQEVAGKPAAHGRCWIGIGRIRALIGVASSRSGQARSVRAERGNKNRENRGGLVAGHELA